MNDQLFELADAWYASRQRGEEIALAELAANSPQLLPELERLTAALAATAWLDQPLNENTESAALASGDGCHPTFGAYEPLDRLGRGGMGEVYRARHLLMDREVAIKLLLPARLANAVDRDRFLREVQILAKLQHQNIVAAYDAFEQDGHLLLVTEFVPGEDATSLLRRTGPFPTSQVIEIGRQAAAGLSHAHAAGVVHRDIKPSNLMLHRDGTVKILDLGVARLLAADKLEDSSLTGARFTLGTPEYLPPEQFADAGSVDQRADVYGLAGTLYCLLTGEPPYGRGGCGEVIVRHREAPIPRISEKRPELGSAWDAFFLRALAKRPVDRFASMEEMSAALATLGTDSARPTAWRMSRRQALQGAAGLGAAALGAGALGLWNFLPTTPRTSALFKMVPPEAASDVEVFSVSQGSEHHYRIVERDPSNGHIRVAMPAGNRLTVHFRHPGYPLAGIRVAHTRILMQPSLRQEVRLVQSGSPYWRIGKREDVAYLEYAAPGFEGWCLDHVGGKAEGWNRVSLTLPTPPKYCCWLVEPMDYDLVMVKAAHLLDKSECYLSTGLSNQRLGTDITPVYLASNGSSSVHWRLVRTDEGLVTLESAAPECGGHYLASESTRPWDDGSRSGPGLAQLNPVAAMRLQF
jgi:serine/threonine protein kinase